MNCVNKNKEITKKIYIGLCMDINNVVLHLTSNDTNTNDDVRQIIIDVMDLCKVEHKLQTINIVNFWILIPYLLNIQNLYIINIETDPSISRPDACKMIHMYYEKTI